MSSYFDSIKSRFNISTVDLPNNPTLNEIDEAEAKLMSNLAAFVGEAPRRSSHYTKKTMAAVQCITALSLRKKPVPGEENVKYYVGTAFAFSWKYLFTAFHIINEPSPEWKIDGVYISDQTNPFKFLYQVKVVGKAKDIDVAVLKCHEAHFFRLPLRCNLPHTFVSVYTVQLVQTQKAIVHQGRTYWGENPWEARCDAPSSDGFSGGPVLDREGQVVGMLRGRSGDADKSFINGVFTTSEGLIRALSLIEGSKSWKWWGLKAVVGATSFLSKEQESSTSRKRPAHEDEPEDHPETKKIATDTLQQEYQPANLPAKEHHVSKPSWRPSVMVKGHLVLSSGGKRL